MSIEALNIKPRDVIAVAVQDDGSCLMVAHDRSGSRPSFIEALTAAAEDAALTQRGVLIPHQSVPSLRRFLMEQAAADKDLPPFLR